MGVPSAKPVELESGMEIGDSILVTGASLQNVCNRNWRWGKKLNRAYIARKEGDGIRVWRTE